MADQTFRHGVLHCCALFEREPGCTEGAGELASWWVAGWR